MEKNVSNLKKQISLSVDSGIVSIVDAWLEQRKKETGGEFTRSSFFERAVMNEIKAKGLVKIITS